MLFIEELDGYLVNVQLMLFAMPLLVESRATVWERAAEWGLLATLVSQVPSVSGFVGKLTAASTRILLLNLITRRHPGCHPSLLWILGARKSRVIIAYRKTKQKNRPIYPQILIKINQFHPPKAIRERTNFIPFKTSRLLNSRQISNKNVKKRTINYPPVT